MTSLFSLHSEVDRFSLLKSSQILIEKIILYVMVIFELTVGIFITNKRHWPNVSIYDSEVYCYFCIWVWRYSTSPRTLVKGAVYAILTTL